MTFNNEDYKTKSIKINHDIAYHIINTLHPNYEGFNDSIRGKELYNFMGLKYFDYNNYTINNLVLFWQETKDQLVYDSIFETYMIIYKKMLPRFLSVSHTIKKDCNSYDLDLFQDYCFILNKCMNEYKYVDNPSFKSYAMNWFQFFLGEQVRKQYFSILSIPQHILKQQRKKNKLTLKTDEEITPEDREFLEKTKNENYNFIKNELNDGIIFVEVEDSILNNVFDKKVTDIFKRLIEERTIKEWQLDCFFKRYGIFGKQYKQTELALIYKVSDSTISKTIKKVIEILKKEPYLKKLYNGG